GELAQSGDVEGARPGVPSPNREHADRSKVRTTGQVAGLSAEIRGKVTMSELTEIPPSSATDALVERLFAAVVDTMEVACVHLGGRLGLSRALAEGDATSAELAVRSGCAERYVREWLEQQAVAGFLTVDDPAAEAAARRYHLPDAHQPVLVDDTDLRYFTP